LPAIGFTFTGACCALVMGIPLILRVVLVVDRAATDYEHLSLSRL
jgi:hypothetical protein